MDSSLYWELAAILALVLANGFFALSEFSVIASRKSRLQQKVEEKRPGARRALQLHEDPDRFLATIQVGITLVATLAGVFGGATLVAPLERALASSSQPWIAGTAKPISVAVVTILITGTAVVLGELVPKYLALSNPERYARFVARPMTLFTAVAAVFSRSLSSVANLIVRLLGVREDQNREMVGEDEINLMIFEGRKNGVFDETEEKLVKAVFDFADSTARRAMTPRTDVVGVDSNTPAETLIDLVIEHGHSRFPVYEGSMDQVIGILYAKDLIHERLDPGKISLEDLTRKAHFVPDSMPLSKVLWDFQRKRNRMAIVLDEFGGTAGIITLHDILEELVGEIQDEDDRDLAELVRHSDTTAFADGSVWPGAVNELLDGHLPEEGFETLAGLIGDHLGRLPEKSETIVIADMEIVVLEMVGNRLVRLRLERKPEVQE